MLAQQQNDQQAGTITVGKNHMQVCIFASRSTKKRERKHKKVAHWIGADAQLKDGRPRASHNADGGRGERRARDNEMLHVAGVGVDGAIDDVKEVHAPRLWRETRCRK